MTASSATQHHRTEAHTYYETMKTKYKEKKLVQQEAARKLDTHRQSLQFASQGRPSVLSVYLTLISLKYLNLSTSKTLLNARKGC